jgi:transcriptional regulator with XRE-family HTH domain
MTKGGGAVKVRLTLQEKIRDLRDEKKLTLTALAEATGIPTATLQRLEANDEHHAAYTDVAALAKFYDVSADYLFGLTDNRRHRNVEIDALRLSDAAIEVLKGGKLNNRLVGEVIAHEDFPALLSAIEIYVDRKVLPQINAVNQMYQLAEEAIKAQGIAQDGDEVLALLQKTVVNEDEYLRYRISERFNAMMKKLFDEHKKDALPDTQQDVLKEFKEGLQTYQRERETQTAERAKLVLLAKQIGLNIGELPDEEIAVLMKALRKSQVLKKYRGRK